MADRIIASGDARPIPQKPVLRIGADYFADPAAPAGEIAFDAACILQGLEEVVQSVISRLENDFDSDSPAVRNCASLAYAALYLTRLAAGMTDAAASARSATIAAERTSS